jgi:hypothetical protein
VEQAGTAARRVRGRTNDEREERVRRLGRIVCAAAGAVATATPAAVAQAYDGYKSSYPQLRAALEATRIPDPDYRSSYPELHSLLDRVVVVAAAPSGDGFDWAAAGIGAAAGSLGAGALAASAARARRLRVSATR